MFIFKIFWKKHIKVNAYFNYFKNFFKQYKTDKSTPTQNILFILKRKKSSYILTILKKGKLVLSITSGTILKYLKIENKCMKRTKKGFLSYMNIFKKSFFRFNGSTLNKTVHVNFFNFYLLYFFKKFKFLFLKNTKVMLNLNVDNTNKYFKKIRGIKKRIVKRKIKLYLKDWSTITTKKNYLNKFKN